ncbi:MAG: HIT domain-containing protein [Gammaproteobacteria bacterium]
MSFRLHPQLAKDAIRIGRFDLCRLLLMNDSRYPWFILVPEVADISEIYQLEQDQRALLHQESDYLSERLARLFNADKMNIAAIGNLVPQLHVHHVVRYRSDAAWPAPVWGKFEAIPYAEAQLRERIDHVTAQLRDRLRE